MTRLHQIAGPKTPKLTASRVGAKATNLAAMARAGLPVPPAFVVPVDLTGPVAAGRTKAIAELDRLLAEGIAFLEAETGRRFGDRRRPLLVSVRSGAARSMPGMLETVLNVGANEAAIAGLVRTSGNPRLALDCRRRLLEGFAETVLGLDPRPLAADLARLIAEERVASDRELDSEALGRHVARCLAHVDGAVPSDPMEQLTAAARAVFRSWFADKAVTYRRLHGLDDLAGTAVTVQAMVYGNADARSGAGVAFSRDPSTGRREPVIELLFDAQGEDVVSGRRTPLGRTELERRLPDAAAALIDALTRLERAFGDVQDVEFTIESGRLWLLQTRAAKRTPRAGLRIAVDLCAEGLIDETEAANRLADLDEAMLDETGFVGIGEPVARGISASPGVASGRIACDSAAAERLSATGDPVILVRPDTSTADIAGFAASDGILTATGGRTAHAALVARQMGRPCVVGCADLAVDEASRTIRFAEATAREGDWLSIDGGDGSVFLGHREIRRERPETDLAIRRSWGKPAAGPGGRKRR